MRFHDIPQNTDEWLDLRVGKLTGSNVGKVMANYGKAFGDPAKKLAASIACEQVTGKRSENESYSNSHMERGHIQEPIARMLYEEQTFSTVTNGGFFECDNEGCSPDGLVHTDGSIEIKSVLAHVHYANIKRGDIEPAYKWQRCFNLKKTEREWIDSVSYCADFPEKTRRYICRKHKDELQEEFKMLEQRTAEFFKLIEQMKAIIKG